LLSGIGFVNVSTGDLSLSSSSSFLNVLPGGATPGADFTQLYTETRLTVAN
jgi:hypothetical protein